MKPLARVTVYLVSSVLCSAGMLVGAAYAASESLVVFYGSGLSGRLCRRAAMTDNLPPSTAG